MTSPAAFPPPQGIVAPNPTQHIATIKAEVARRLSEGSFKTLDKSPVKPWRQMAAYEYGHGTKLYLDGEHAYLVTQTPSKKGTTQKIRDLGEIKIRY